jgi:hypothetical protein
MGQAPFGVWPSPAKEPANRLLLLLARKFE